MNKTVASVIDDINEWKNPYKEGEFVYYVTAFFTDGEVGSAGRTDMDAALEVQGLLQETIGQELDFVLEPKKPTKSGKPAWKILGFGTPGGAATYTAPGVQGGGGTDHGGGSATSRYVSGRSPEHDQQFRSPDDFRAEAAVRAAIEGVAASGRGFDLASWLSHGIPLADAIYNWMSDKTSEPASSAYEGGGTDTVLPVGSPVVQAGVGSEQSAGEKADDPAARGEGQSGGGEAQDCPPHDLDLDVAPKAMRYPCRRCGFWVKPTMAAEEAEEARD